MQVTKGTWRMSEQCVPGSLSSSPHKSLGTRLSPHKTNMVLLFFCAESSITAPQDAHKRLVVQVAEWLAAGFKGGARQELTT